MFAFFDWFKSFIFWIFDQPQSSPAKTKSTLPVIPDFICQPIFIRKVFISSLSIEKLPVITIPFPIKSMFSSSF